MSRAFRKGLWVITITYWLVLFTLTHIPRPPRPPIPMTDKMEHLLAYGLLATLLTASMRASQHRDAAIRVLVIAICYGAIDEWLQAIPFIHRSCDFLDWCADVAGASCAVVLITLIADRIARPRAA